MDKYNKDQKDKSIYLKRILPIYILVYKLF